MLCLKAERYLLPRCCSTRIRFKGVLTLLKEGLLRVPSTAGAGGAVVLEMGATAAAGGIIMAVNKG
jgi:hypothetical protein